ncbi:MAG: ComEC/Rec2 family competence protein [Chlamydiales bacterium]|nr:ComEC/Rec2 family competence protein [Chlamydiales bacterium]
MKTALNRFEKKYPALLSGILLLLGMSSPNHLFLHLVILSFFFFFLKKGEKILYLSLFLIGYLLAPSIDFLDVDKEKGIPTTAHFSIDSVQSSSSPFCKSLIYKGKLSHFPEEHPCHGKTIASSIYFKDPQKRPRADRDYQIEGLLHPNLEHSSQPWIFKPKKNATWKPIEKTYRLAELRYSAKKSLLRYFQKHTDNPLTASFFHTLLTSDIEENSLAMDFGKIGVQHILAISGFHFALIALFLGFILLKILPPRWAYGALLFLLSLYYLFLGDSPSIQRAWIAISLLLLGKIFNLRGNAINTLGVCLCLEILCNPSIIDHVGFVLSFLSTLSILLLFPLILPLFDPLFPTRTFSNIQSMRLLDQCGYLIGSFFKQALAINIAVHIVCIPILLHLFHRFPCLSLLYNLFLPYCVGITLLLLCTTLILFPLPYLDSLLFSINTSWSSSLLTITSNPPVLLDFTLYSNLFSYEIVLLFLTSLFLFIIYSNEKKIESLV